MRLVLKPLAWCALCALLGAFQGRCAQTSPAPRKSAPDPAAQELNRLLTTAQEAIDRRDYETAARHYQDYLTKKPDDATVHYDLGYVYTALKQPVDAKSEYEKAIALNPKMGAAYQNLGLTLLPTDPSAAIALLQKAAELLPTDGRTKWLLGAALEKNDKLPAAIEQYRAAEKVDDKDPDIRVSLGRALLSAGHASDAETALREALSLHPAGDSLAEAHLCLAQALIAEKKLDEGASELALYLQHSPNDIAARITHASVLVDMGKDDDALAELDQASTAGPEGLRAMRLRSQIYFEKKRYNDDIPLLQRAAAIAPKDPDISARLGRVYLLTKDYPSAVRWLAAAYNMNPSATDLLGDAVEAEYLNKNYGETLAGLDELSKRKVLPMGSWYMRATCYDHLGQAPQALGAYQKFLQLNKDENSDMYFVSTARVRVLTRELQNKKR
jgi:tetratricopeptide (TPR) repeat protein